MKIASLKLSICSCIMGVTMIQYSSAQKPVEIRNEHNQLSLDNSKFSLEIELDLAEAMITAPGIKLRYFLNDKAALRLGFNYSSSKATYMPTVIDSVPGGFVRKTGKYVNTEREMVISPGLEFHMAGTDKLSPYIGFGLSIGRGNSKTEGINASDPSTYVQDYSFSSDMPWSSIGWELIAGADYYFAKSFYAGVEFSLGGERKEKWGQTSTTAAGMTVITKIDESKNTTVGVAATGGIRLGWRF